jgi:hypothetical protein
LHCCPVDGVVISQKPPPHWRFWTAAFKVGQKPVDADTVTDVLAPELDGLEARLMRNGYNIKLLIESNCSTPV